MVTKTRIGPSRPEHHEGPLAEWLLEDHREESNNGPYPNDQKHETHPWWQVMCLTGLDYFSTLGYQPGIAALAAGLLSPLATLVLVLLTLCGALPVYRWVARASPHGEGSLAMLERLLSWWQGKLFILALLGFVATDFIVTITLSAADATAHVIENPFVPDALDAHPVLVTLFLIGLLGAVFLKGFKEAIGIAVALVGAYLALNFVVVVVAIQHVLTDPAVIGNWRNLLAVRYDNIWLMIGISLILFPRLALGLSGFETGVVVMPLVKGAPNDTPRKPAGRIRNTAKLLTAAATIMSVFLITSSLTTTLLIPHEAFLPGGPANGRALAYLAHAELGEGFGSIYDLSTILILWFAGASAMAGLLNIVPRYLPRYGMAPEWARAVRPLTLVFTVIAFAVTVIFRANVDAQGGAYATGVLVLITSAAFAVMLSARRKRRTGMTIFFAAIFLIFLYTTIVNMIERPDGLKIAAFFITAIVVVSFISRIWRSTELRATEVQFDNEAMRFLQEASAFGPIRLIANHPDERNSREYLIKEREEREAAHIPAGDPVMFLEVKVRDASDFASTVKVRGEEISGYRVLSAESASVPNGIAATLLAIRNETHERPHIYFGWTEGNPLKYLARFVLFGEGDIAPVTREILRKAEPDRARRPAVHVG